MFAPSSGSGGSNKLTKQKPGSAASNKNELAEVYRGLVSDAYPDLLLPPNALPLIVVKVTSSRLRPARHSLLSLKGSGGHGDEPQFTLGVSARADYPRQLWRVEKPASALQQLHANLIAAQPTGLDLPVPDRALFSGQSPAKVDARREALEDFFERLLDTPLTEKAALVLCSFLSTHVIQPEESAIARSHAISTDNADKASMVSSGTDNGPTVKEGYLTKRGKNFGGWKARYFVLAEGLLRYSDAPGGQVLGTIRLGSAQIGRQSRPSTESSPSRGGEDGEVRHAFLILEPKRRDAKHLIRHVLCAENDVERDEWVHALLQHIGQAPATDPKAANAKGGLLSSVMHGKRDESERRDRDREQHSETSTLQGFSYEDAAPGGPIRTESAGDTPSPVAASFRNDNNSSSQSTGARTISAPRDGAPIQDAGAWGNKALESPRIGGPAPSSGPKKRNLWGFRERTHESANSNDSNGGTGGGAPRPPANQRPIFGMPLAEAVRLHPARGSEDVALPSVLFRCLQYLETRGAENEEGLFRLSGSNTLIRQLKDRFNAEGDLDFLAEGAYYDVHAVASLLKQYLRELPDMVLTRELHLQFLQILGTYFPLPSPSSYQSRSSNPTPQSIPRSTASPPTTCSCTASPSPTGPSSARCPPT